MKKRHYTFPETMNMDGALQRLALYEVTKGQMVIPTEFEEMLGLHRDIAVKFNEFKKRIQIGDCDFEFIRDHVLGTYGPFSKKDNVNLASTVEEMIDKVPQFEALRKMEESQKQELENRVMGAIGQFITEEIGGEAGLGEDMREMFRFPGITDPGITDPGITEMIVPPEESPLSQEMEIETSEPDLPVEENKRAIRKIPRKRTKLTDKSENPKRKPKTLKSPKKTKKTNKTSRKKKSDDDTNDN